MSPSIPGPRIVWALLAVCMGGFSLQADPGPLRACIRPGDSLYIQDIRSGEVLNLDDRKPVPAASLVKLFVMVEAFKAFGDGRLDKNGSVTVSPQDIVGGAGVIRLGGAGCRYTWYRLVQLMIQESDNIAANLLIQKIGMLAINETARDMGFHQTRVVRMMMDTVAMEQGLENMTSARDVGRLLKSIAEGQCLDEAVSREMMKFLSGQKRPGKLGSLLPASASIAHKTGELVLPGAVRVEGDAGIISGPGGRIVMVVISVGDCASVAHLAAMGKLAWEHFGLADRGVSHGSQL
ncbi:MAG TPA: class A beta-lactamase-related serine hydrolase [Spirochaetota bacterium]|nr:class A beta-lactamase-related serine hydrolase [Spirochaetota bacterium]HPH02221.1 class A beta-lactamase-related serine hydrolase [Spirochaetota bacterium]